MIWLNKKSLLRLGVGILVLWLAVFFLFDPVLKLALKKAGAAAAGAKVDIASVKSSWRRGRLDVTGVAVGDKNSPMTNVVEASRLGFTFDVGGALRGKAVVREASIEGLRFGTPRATSGALPHPPPPSKLDLALREKLGSAGTAALGGKPDVKANAAATVDAAKLSSLKKLDEAKAQAKEIEERWKGKRAEAAQIAKEAQQAADDLKSLGGGNFLQNAQKAAQTQKKLKDLMHRIDDQRDQAKKDLAQLQDAYKQAEELRGKDVNGLLAAAGMPTLDSQDLARRLLGPQVAARLGVALHWIRWAREKAAERKKAAAAAPPPPARRQGIDIEFPRAHSYPQFLLENAKLSGELDGALMGRNLDLAGVLNGVTSNPDLYGKPATLTLSGGAANGEAMRLEGRLDQQRNPVDAVVHFSGSGFSLAGTSLGDGEIGGALAAGRASVSGEIGTVGDSWKGELRLEATGVALEPKITLDGVAGKAVADALKSINSFRVDVSISGKEDDLKLSFSSNIGDVMAGAMKKAFSGQFESQRKAVEAQVNALYGPHAKDAHGATDGLSSKLLGPLDSQRAGLERQLQDALKKSVGGAPNFKKLFR